MINWKGEEIEPDPGRQKTALLRTKVFSAQEGN
jgi:hypothetical protein